MQMVQKKGLAIECSDNTHNDCTPMRDAVLKLKQVTEAYTTNVMEGDSIYCVAATAVGTTKELSDLRKKIKRIHTKARNLGVEKVEMY